MAKKLASSPTTDELRSRARRLFEFLQQVVRQREQTVRIAEDFAARPPGRVLWFSSLADHPEITTSLGGERDDPWLVVDRPSRSDPPVPGEILEPHLHLDQIADPDAALELRGEERTRFRPDGTVERHFEDPSEEVLRAFEAFRSSWEQWATEERRRRLVRTLYSQLFAMHQQLADSPEEVELILAVGCLSWSPDDHPDVRRHLVERKASIEFTETTGRIGVSADPSEVAARHELEMLEQERWPPAARRRELDDDLSEFEGNLLAEWEVGPLLRRWANVLAPDGRYDEGLTAVRPGPAPTVSFAPALVLRRRSNRGLLRLYQQILDDLDSEASDIPLGIRQLIDTVEDHELTDGGGGKGHEEEAYLPLPANREQLELVHRFRTYDHVVVQGPPGTGKTHTIANLLCHLLATGNRVLITAQTDRALRELRAKLPAEVVELCVSVVGRERSDLQDLAVAARAIEDRATSYSKEREEKRLDQLRERLDELRRQRAEVVKEIVVARESETIEVGVGPYRGTLGQLEQRVAGDRERFGWLDSLLPSSIDDEPPIAVLDALRLLHLLRGQDEQEELLASQNLVDPAELATVGEFERLVARERSALEADDEYRRSREDPRYSHLAALPRDARDDAVRRAREIVRELEWFASRHESWIGAAVADALAGKVTVWRKRHKELTARLAKVERLLAQLGHTRVEVQGDLTVLARQARALGKHLKKGGKLKGLITPKPVKAAQLLLETVVVNGSRPDTLPLLTAFMQHVLAHQALDAADRLWPHDVRIPQEDTPHERLAWHQDEATILSRAIALRGLLDELEDVLRQSHVSPPDFREEGDVKRWFTMLKAVDSAEALQSARQPIHQLETLLDVAAQQENASFETARLLEAVRTRDVAGYGHAWNRIRVLKMVNRAVTEREQLLQELDGYTALVQALKMSAHDEQWEERLESLAQAWAWARAARALSARSDPDLAALEARLDGIDASVASTMTELTAGHAWSHAVGRLGGTERQALKAYVHAIRKLGKGTGKYAAHRRRDARDALQHCRPAVPAWVMPIYRIAETLDVERDAFDVVIIDEASQASVEAAFLQYLAGKIVVVGDDKQVSPSGVGIDRSQLIGLRRQYLDGIPFAATYENPETSFFDQAKIRYGRMITLREHFRCMPEIIGFSNRIAYEPDGVPLIPLRQYGMDRLDPMRTVYVSNGYEKGSASNKVNMPEVESVVETVLKCCADPAYDGKTMGVISLTGSQQADEISRRLLQELDPTEIASRELRCGIPPDFQGSERHVMFLTMVAAPMEGQRMAALTRELYLQRFNVAASRAQDQMWLFHSMTLEDLSNKEDMRYQLLDYCLRTVSSGSDDSSVESQAVSENEPDPRFDSLFEQHVFNRIVERGYHVVPQYHVQGFKIDLVVIGGRSRLGIECDGEFWHGPEQYERDLARQRELERCGWTFFRIRGSAFYRDRYETLAPLWELLDNHEIYPVGYKPPRATPHISRTEAIDGNGEAAAHDADVERVLQDEMLDVTTGVQKLSGIQDVGASDDVPSTRFEFTVASGRHMRGATSGLERGEYDLLPYESWHATGLRDPRFARRDDLVDGLCEIVEVEGPVVGARAYRLFVQASGGQKLGKRSARALSEAAAYAIRSRRLASSNPLGAAGQKAQTFHIPDTPEVVARVRGPRDLVEIPPSEIAELMRRILDGRGVMDDEELFREALRVYELVRLTPKVETLMQSCRTLV